MNMKVWRMNTSHKKIKLISNDPKVVFLDAKVENVINVTVIYVTVLTFKMLI